MKAALFLLLTLLVFRPAVHAADAGLPSCLLLGNAPDIRSVVEDAGIGESEILARLVYAESISTGFPDDPLVYEAIAWGVMNRVRLAGAFPAKRKLYGSGIPGVVFMKGQFNPAVSKRSQFSKEFLCPRNDARWRMAVEAAGRAMEGSGNPFITTPWEKEHGLSLVVGFYYPRSIQARSLLAPWERSRALRFIGDVVINGKTLSGERVRFYRLTSPPAGTRPAASAAPRDRQ